VSKDETDGEAALLCIRTAASRADQVRSGGYPSQDRGGGPQQRRWAPVALPYGRGNEGLHNSNLFAAQTGKACPPTAARAFSSNETIDKGSASISEPSGGSSADKVTSGMRNSRKNRPYRVYDQWLNHLVASCSPYPELKRDLLAKVSRYNPRKRTEVVQLQTMDKPEVVNDISQNTNLPDTETSITLSNAGCSILPLIKDPEVLEDWQVVFFFRVYIVTTHSFKLIHATISNKLLCLS
jgi:hypothetical protein